MFALRQLPTSCNKACILRAVQEASFQYRPRRCVCGSDVRTRTVIHQESGALPREGFDATKSRILDTIHSV